MEFCQSEKVGTLCIGLGIAVGLCQCELDRGDAGVPVESV